MCREGSLEYFVSLDKIARDFSHKHQVKAIELLLAYGHGRPAQTMSMRKITSITDLTDEELDLLTNDPEGAG